jgi:hypothetical protein
MATAVKVRRKVFDGIEDLRKFGGARMTDVPRVISMLEKMGKYAASDWVQENCEQYVRGLCDGFEIE